MQSFNWVDIDGIRYSWDGQGSITCTGQFGYQATMAGDRIDGLDLESEDGDVAAPSMWTSRRPPSHLIRQWMLSHLTGWC